MIAEVAEIEAAVFMSLDLVASRRHQRITALGCYFKVLSIPDVMLCSCRKLIIILNIVAA